MSIFFEDYTMLINWKRTKAIRMNNLILKSVRNYLVNAEVSSYFFIIFLKIYKKNIIFNHLDVEYYTVFNNAWLQTLTDFNT